MVNIYFFDTQYLTDFVFLDQQEKTSQTSHICNPPITDTMWVGPREEQIWYHQQQQEQQRFVN
jgi:hypothetical protein